MCLLGPLSGRPELVAATQGFFWIRFVLQAAEALSDRICFATACTIDCFFTLSRIEHCHSMVPHTHPVCSCLWFLGDDYVTGVTQFQVSMAPGVPFATVALHSVLPALLQARMLQAGVVQAGATLVQAR